MAQTGDSYDWDVVNQGLTTDFAEVTYSRTVRKFRIQARGEITLYHKRRITDSNFITIKAGSNHPYEVLLNSSSVSLGFFATESGSDTLEGLVFF